MKYVFAFLKYFIKPFIGFDGIDRVTKFDSDVEKGWSTRYPTGIRNIVKFELIF